MFTIKSQNIKDFPFEDYASLEDSKLEAQAKSHGLTNFNSWMLPQILAHYGNWKFKFVDNKVDYNLTRQENITTSWDIGLWRVCTRLKRGSLVKAQNRTPQYSALVPFILAGAKVYQGIKYSSWTLDNKCYLVEPKLLELMLWRDDSIHSLGSKRLLEIRQQGLTTKSGLKAGQVSDPKSQWCLTGIRDTELGGSPVLVNTVLTQIWVAHPSLRHELMVLDPYNWDEMPPPLIEDQIFIAPKPLFAKIPKVTNLGSELPWMMETA
jgi:hypothetical protein